MKTAQVTIRGVSPYSQSKHYDTTEVPKLQGESHRDYEQRTWSNRLHVNNDGNIFIPPMSFKNSMSEAAKFLGIQIAGKGKSTYTKHIESGVLVVDPMVLPIKKEEVESECLFVPSDGIRGSGKRVEKVFPLIREWGGTFEILIFDETVLNSYDASKITVLQHIVQEAGKFIGLGRFRPRNNGYYGRYEVTKFTLSGK
jgi:hypothetical protein